MRKLDVNKILTDAGYKADKRFGDIASWAASQRFEKADEVLASVAHVFGDAPEKRADLPQKAAPLSEFLMPHGNEELIAEEAGARNQMYKALRLPVALRGALMPDAQLGYALPIGGVIDLAGAVSPSFVGVDIFCRMRASILDQPAMVDALEEEEYRGYVLDKVLQNTSFGIGASTAGKYDDSVMYDSLWDELKVLSRLKDTAREQLGSSGGGNHFCAVLTGELIHGYHPFGERGKKFVVLLTHSGSRGTGFKVAKHYTDIAYKVASQRWKIEKEHGWLGIDTEYGQEYLAAMNLMGRYAAANHSIIHAEVLSALGVSANFVVENNHNFAEVLDDDVVRHRKGATPAGVGTLGIIPGSSGTNSYIVEGLGNEHALLSASHGAGRMRSSSASKAVFDEAAFEESMRGITHYGIAKHESPHAYKDITAVISAQIANEMIRPVMRMSPKVVVMGGSSRD